VAEDVGGGPAFVFQQARVQTPQAVVAASRGAGLGVSRSAVDEVAEGGSCPGSQCQSPGMISDATRPAGPSATSTAARLVSAISCADLEVLRVKVSKHHILFEVESFRFRKPPRFRLLPEQNTRDPHNRLSMNIACKK